MFLAILEAKLKVVRSYSNRNKYKINLCHLHRTYGILYYAHKYLIFLYLSLCQPIVNRRSCRCTFILTWSVLLSFRTAIRFLRMLVFFSNLSWYLSKWPQLKMLACCLQCKHNASLKVTQWSRPSSTTSPSHWPWTRLVTKYTHWTS